MAKQPPLFEYLTIPKIGEKPKRFGQLFEKISASLATAGVTAEAVLATLQETRQQLYELRYGATQSKGSR